MSKIIGVLMASVLFFAFTGQAGAFCVHNNSDIKFEVQQVTNGSFWKRFDVEIDPGQQACCPWDEKDCNKSGGPADPVGLTAVNPYVKEACTDYKIPANGNLYIKGAGANSYCSQKSMLFIINQF